MKNHDFELLSVAVWGTGSWAGHTLQVLRTLGVKNLLVGGDPKDHDRADRISGLAQKHGAEPLYGVDQLLLCNCNAVILALPPAENLSHAKEFLKAGLDLFVQKPLALNFGEAQEMWDLAIQEKRILMGGSDLYYRPDIISAKSLMASGSIGTPTYIYARMGNVLRPSGWRTDILADMGEHAVGLVHELVGKAVTVRSERQGSYSGQFYFQGRSWSAVTRLSWQSDRGPGPEIVVEGTEGTLYLNVSTVDSFTTVKRKGIDKLWRWPALQRSLATSRKSIQCTGAYSYFRKLKVFLDAVQTGKVTRSFSDDLENFRIADQAISSMEERTAPVIETDRRQDLVAD